jgi:hypothetical protein
MAMAGSSVYDAGYPALLSPDFTRQVKTQRSSLSSPAVDRIVVASRERDPITQVMVKSSWTYSVAYEVEQVAPRTADEFYVLGSTDGKYTIERWVIPRHKGGYFGDRAMSTEPIGTPVVTPSVEIGITGTWTDPSLRRDPIPTRSTIYTGKDFLNVQSIEVDPDGRFIVCLAEVAAGKGLFRIPNTVGATPQLIYNSSIEPELTEASWITVYEHPTLGKSYVAPSVVDDTFVVANDIENDGIFDGTAVYTYAVWNSGSTGVPEEWTDDFLNYYP